jgi:hypothetical protein
MEEQEHQIALLRERVIRLEGGDDENIAPKSNAKGGSSVDDFSIKVGSAYDDYNIVSNLISI